MEPVSETIALVTGASRGVGRGIAHELGLAGATVYVTGRSRRGEETTDDLPGTIDETAELVTSAGGMGIALPCDHTDDDAVEALAAEIEARSGRLDLLVNNAWGGYEAYDTTMFELAPADQPLWRWDKMFATGVRAQYTTTRALLPLLLRGRRPLVVNISFGDDGKFLGDVQYDVAKAAVDRLAFAIANRHRADGLVAVALYPGFTLTERVEMAFSEGEIPPECHTPRFVGRLVVALRGDPDVAQRSGGAFKAGQLGLDYAVTDVDGSQPAPFCLPEA